MMQNNEKKINNDESCECGKINYDCSKNNKIVELWINDPSVFFDKKKLLEVWPNENMDREEKVKKECKERRDNPLKLTALQKKLNNLITLQDE